MTSILVLDDRETDRDLLATVLGYAGYAVLEASTGDAALELARARQPDLIIADILMPAMNGYEFVRELRLDPTIGNTAVIFATATYGMEEVTSLADACGVSHFLPKPSEPEAIIRLVGEVLGSDNGVAPPVPVQEFDREQLRILNNKLVEKVNELEVANHEQEQRQEHLRQTERQAAESLTLLETLQSTAPVGFGFVDRELRFVRVNETLAAIHRLSAELHLGRTVADVVPDIWPQVEPLYRRVLESGEAVVNLPIEREIGDPGEAGYWLTSFYPVRIGDDLIGIGVVVVDITESKQAEDFRSVVMENMAEGLYALDADGRLMFMNAAASRMLGWTEDELRGKSVHSAIHFQRADGTPFPEDECEVHAVHTVGRTVRVADDAFTRNDGVILPVAYSAAPLLDGASVRGIVVVFRDTTEERAEQTRGQRQLDALTWVGAIRDALEEDRLVLYSQPIVPLAGGDPSEELLLRMVGRDGEIIAPGSFLPVAEKYGLIGEIDRWVIAETIRLAAGPRRVEANLSAQSISDLDLLSLIGRRLRETGADPSDIVFEITETALMEDVEAGEIFARGLADIGCGLALDDFGTGFGSFNYLKTLPMNYLKIDTGFVRDLVSNPANQHLVKAIVGLARDFGYQTIAEGVENGETLERLQEYGVDFAQGFHLGRPAPITDSPVATQGIPAHPTSRARRSLAGARGGEG
jgi:PAS domain S-box-containing protein